MTRIAIVLSAALVLTACSQDSKPPPAERVVTLVPRPVSAYSAISARGPGGDLQLTGELREAAVPVTAARSFAHGRSLAEYGLDQPRGSLEYVVGEDEYRIELSIGGPTFDGRGVYISRRDDPRIYLVFVDRLGPVLAAAGIGEPATP